MRTKRTTLLASLAVTVALFVSACGIFGESQAERDLSKTLEVYHILKSRYIDRNELDVLALNQGAVQGVVQSLAISNEEFEPRIVLGTNGTNNMDGLLAVYEKLSESYFGGDQIDLEAVNESAIISMIATLNDPFTHYFSRPGWEKNEQLIEGTFAGIGAEVSLVNGQLTIVAPVPGSPADEAGLLTGDVVLEADGISLAGLSLAIAIERIRGPKGSIIELTVLRPGTKKPIVFKIERDIIEQVTVRVQDLGDGIWRMRISQFANPTDEQFRAALSQYTSRATEGSDFNGGIVLDLRNNPGGLLETAVHIASEFLNEGLVLYEVDANGRRTEHEVRSGGIGGAIPTVVLVNGGSASASEVVAGALQSTGRATVIGTQTFGKGVVNLPVELSDGSGLYVTVTRWFMPDGGQIGNEGITPDIVIKRTAHGDVQLDKAVAVLKSEITRDQDQAA